MKVFLTHYFKPLQILCHLVRPIKCARYARPSTIFFTPANLGHFFRHFYFVLKIVFGHFSNSYNFYNSYNNPNSSNTYNCYNYSNSSNSYSS